MRIAHFSVICTIASAVALFGCAARGTAPSPSSASTFTTSSDLAVGKGPAVGPGDRVTVRFVEGHSADAVLDSSSPNATQQSFNVGSAGGNGGLNDAALGMQAGGRRRFVVPAAEAAQNLGTAPGPQPSVGALRVLDVTLLSIDHP
jgi:FKBP-type peptidyl-prolyl cis-trans isomerase